MISLGSEDYYTLLNSQIYHNTMNINYYIFDKIEQEDLGCYWGYLGNDFCEVFPLSSEDTEDELIQKGFAKCDAPGTETFVVEESAWEALK